MNIKTFVKDILTMIDQNSNKKDKGRRYEENIKSFSTYLFVSGGRSLYECMRQNLSLPSVPTVLNYIRSEKSSTVEGFLRIEELIKFLKDRQFSKCIWLSEDQTRVISKVEYDPKTNQMVGFVLPLDSVTGMPIVTSFPANTASDIINAFRSSETSTLVNVIIAHPIQDGAPTFCLCLYGTSYKFTTADVLKRWKYIIDQCKENDKFYVIHFWFQEYLQMGIVDC